MEIDVIEVNKEHFDACTYPIGAKPIPHVVHSNPSPYQVEGFVVRPRNSTDVKYLISKNKEECLSGLKVQLQWTNSPTPWNWYFPSGIGQDD